MVRDRRLNSVDELRAEAIRVREFSIQSKQQAGETIASYTRFHCNALELLDGNRNQVLWCRIEDVETYGHARNHARFCLPSSPDTVKIVDLCFQREKDAERFVSVMSAHMQAFVNEKNLNPQSGRLQLCSEELRKACRDLSNRY